MSESDCRQRIVFVCNDVLMFVPVLGIRMFLGLPDPDPLVRGTDLEQDPDPSLNVLVRLK
jgi:hypothetical protein